MRNARTLLTAVIATLAVTAGAMATDVYWSGDTSTDFNDMDNWVGDVLPVLYTHDDGTNSFTSGDVAVFDGTGNVEAVPLNLTPTLSASFGSLDGSGKVATALQGMVFVDSGWTLDTTATDNTGPFIVVTYREPGDIDIDSQATTGVNTINGYLRVSSKNNNDNTRISIAPGGTLRINGIMNTLEDVNGSNNSGAIYVEGGGTLELNLAGGNSTRVGSNGYLVKGGSTVKVFAETAGGWTGDGTAGLGTQNNRALTIDDGTWDMNGNTLDVNSLRLNANGVLTNTDLANTARLDTRQGGGTSNIAGRINGNVDVVWNPNASATWVLSGQNEYTGTTKIRGRSNASNDVVVIVATDALENQNGAFGNGSSAIDFGGNTKNFGGLYLLTNGAFEVGRDVDINLRDDSTTPCIIGADDSQTDTSTFSGDITVGQNIAAVMHVTAGVDGRVNFTGNILEEGGGTEGAITKIGDGVVSFSGDNTYAGGTTVTAGTLLIENTTGSGTGTGNVSVQAGRLGGTGSISADLDFSAGGTFLAMIAGALNVDGAITAGGGTLATDDTLVDSEYTIMTHGSGMLSGLFTLDASISGQGYDVMYDDTMIKLVTAGPAVLLGDANNDGVVSADDFAAVQTNFGNTGAADGLLPGDANDDGVVSADDFAAIQTNFGNVLGAATEAAPVPEPATMCLMMFGGLAMTFRRRRSA